MALITVADCVSQDAAPSFIPVLAPSTILGRLRLETRGEHDAVERVLDLMGSSLTESIYRQRLVQLYGFYGPLEAALQARCAMPDDGLGREPQPLATLAPRLIKAADRTSDFIWFSCKRHFSEWL